ncbi:phosphomannomutase/phosphoglucomutase [Candidatus Peregrinibacteria bacterium]|nr:phosphomannomutase/phosphoglucomutase [Candidatus Peregrinibacteria bacterium]
MLSDHIFRAYDIRGIYGKDFDENGAELIGKAYAAYLQELSPNRKLKIALGRDGRKSGEILEKAFLKGVVESGIDVVQIGMVSSPLLFFAICDGKFDGGVTITASHNPQEYNGFKLQRDHAHAICGEEIQKVLQIIHEKKFHVPKEKGTQSKMDFREIYFSKLRSLSNFSSEKKPKIVIDAGNGIMGNFAPDFFRNLGCEVIELYCEVDGTFPNHDADPEREENLQDLKKKVLEERADFGVAFDGDGDRVGILDDKGNHYSADLLLLLLSRDLLTRYPGASIVFDLKSTEVLSEEIQKLGGKALMCKTGHSFVEEMMEKEKALLGGEVSGHLFFAEDYYGYDDALLAAFKILTVVWNSGKKLEEHFADLRRTFITPEIKVKISEHEKFAIMKKIVQHFLTKYPDALTIDGIRIEFGEGAWGIIRVSNTSAYLTMRFEARSEEKLSEIQKIVFDHLEEYAEISGIPEVELM